MGWLSYAHIIIYSIYTGPISHWGESKYCQVSNGNCGGCGYRLASRLEKRSSRSSPLRSLSLNNRTELSLSLSRRRNPEWVAPRRDSQNGSRFSGSRGWKSAMKSEPKSAARRAVQPVATWHRVTGVRPKWTNKRGSWFHPSNEIGYGKKLLLLLNSSIRSQFFGSGFPKLCNLVKWWRLGFVL